MTLVVGLMGGIGSGKSAVAQAFAERGAVVIDADRLGHEALLQPALRQEIVRLWGTGLLERGEIDRRRLAKVVFGRAEERNKLEALVHPWIRARAEEQIAQARENDVPLVVVDAAVLLEAGWGKVCDRLIFVDASPEVRQQRVVEKRGWDAEHWQDREAAQLPLTRKRAHADHVLENSSSLEHVTRQVDDLIRLWGLAPAPWKRSRN